MSTPIAIWLADKLEDPTNTHGFDLVKGNAAAELIRQHNTIMAQRKALELAWDALKYIGYVPRADGSHPVGKAITAIQEQLK